MQTKVRRPARHPVCSGQLAVWSEGPLSSESPPSGSVPREENYPREPEST